MKNNKILKELINEKIALPISLLKEGEELINNKQLKEYENILNNFSIYIENKTKNKINLNIITEVIADILGFNMKMENTLFSKELADNLDVESKQLLTFIHYLSTYGMDNLGLERNIITYNNNFNKDDKKLKGKDLLNIIEIPLNNNNLKTFNIKIVNDKDFIKDLCNYLENISKPLSYSFKNNILNNYLKEISKQINIGAIKFKENKDMIIGMLVDNNLLNEVDLGFADTIRYVYNKIYNEIFGINPGGFLYTNQFKNIDIYLSKSKILNKIIDNAFEKNNDYYSILRFYKQRGKRKIINKIGELLRNDNIKKLQKEFEKNYLSNIKTKYGILKNGNKKEIKEILIKYPSLIREETYVIINHILDNKIDINWFTSYLIDTVKNNKITLKSMISVYNYITMLKQIVLDDNRTTDYLVKMPIGVFTKTRRINKIFNKDFNIIEESILNNKEIKKVIFERIGKAIKEKYGRLIFENESLFNNIFNDGIKLPVSVRAESGYLFEEGTYINIDSKITNGELPFFTGVYWKGEEADLDLYGVLEKSFGTSTRTLEQISYNSDYESSGLTFSGDVTDGRDGASEAIYTNGESISSDVKNILIFIKKYAPHY